MGLQVAATAAYVLCSLSGSSSWTSWEPSVFHRRCAAQSGWMTTLHHAEEGVRRAATGHRREEWFQLTCIVGSGGDEDRQRLPASSAWATEVRGGLGSHGPESWSLLSSKPKFTRRTGEAIYRGGGLSQSRMKT